MRMKKKEPTRLALQKETLRSLTDRKLELPQGGTFASGGCFTWIYSALHCWDSVQVCRA